MTTKRGNWTGLHGTSVIVLIGVALYFLFVEHANHVLPYLPYFILLLCPLMHLFMHKSHSGKKHDDADQSIKDAYQRGLEEGRKQSTENSKD
ncbi:DUF2933 domain-containing protein [Idiomarina sp. ST10R2A5]|uniref:DUF2933 domain-containing protein n=1 Tax=Idiomarina sp. ST10R2A5 TaxID=3418368 RepID=UPI003EC4B451